MKTGIHFFQSRSIVVIIMILLIVVVDCTFVIAAEPLSSEPEAAARMLFMPAEHPQANFFSDAPILPTLNAVTVDGGNFIARNSSVNINYGSSGCIYTDAAVYVVSRLNLPKDAVIKYLRIYFNITDNTKYITSWVTTYDLVTGDYSDLISLSSGTGYTGRGTVISSETTASVNTDGHAYTIIASMPGGSTTRFCGATVYYYDPPTFTTQQLVVE